jgi:hypothetical protein
VRYGVASTLSLDKKAAPPPKKPPVPVFDENENTAEVHTPEGIGYLQLKNFFNRQKVFVSEAPEHMWMAPMTPEQRKNLAIQRQKNAQFFASAKPKIREAGLPQKVIDAERENARAHAAETQAA